MSIQKVKVHRERKRERNLLEQFIAERERERQRGRVRV